ncbi:craniofacial development protein 2-like [Schistocerca piceifrons]|uniref:craniofacial development protein 2-like n=1 Tax=Schistocerca piceifrons TaxID=274613 RepID=UPI001F5F2018|nr:craniofacial development protein 2-like [Schistocerca piceifrons]
MLPGYDTPTDAAPIVRKTAIIDRELLRLCVDVAALQETRLSGEGSLREDNSTFFWKGREIGERREHGVGFAVRNSFLSCCEQTKSMSERLTTLRLKTTSGPVTLISAYAPTMKAPPEVKDMFYEDLRKCQENVRGSDKLMLLGDFNARVGNKRNNWTHCIGPYGIGNMNENGQRLLELCTSLSLCITNTYFQNRDVHKVTWKHPRSGHWHQLDFIITRRSDLRHVLNSRTYHSADCDTDHSLVMTKSRFTPKKIHSAESVCRRVKINTKAIQEDTL